MEDDRRRRPSRGWVPMLVLAVVAAVGIGSLLGDRRIALDWAALSPLVAAFTPSDRVAPVRVRNETGVVLLVHPGGRKQDNPIVVEPGGEASYAGFASGESVLLAQPDGRSRLVRVTERQLQEGGAVVVSPGFFSEVQASPSRP